MIDRVIARYLARTAADVKFLVNEYSDLPLECDGQTRVLHTVPYRAGIPHKVMQGSGLHMAASDSDKGRAIYVGVFLDKMDRQRLLKAIPPIHEKVWADHMTLEFRDSPTGSVDASKYPLGKTVAMKVIGVVEDSRAQAAVVQMQGIRMGDGERTPHITISTAEGTNPQYSNELLRRGFEPHHGGLMVRGKVAWWDGQRTRTDW